MGAFHLVLALYGTLALSIPLGKRQDDLGGGFGSFTMAANTLGSSGSDTFGGGDASVFNPDSNIAFTATALQDPSSGQIASGEPATAPTFPISNEPNSGEVAQIASAGLPTVPTSPTFQLPPGLNLGSITPVTPFDVASLAPVTPPVPETPATPPVTPAEPPATPPVAEIPATPATPPVNPATPPVNPATPDSKVVATLASADGHIPLDKAPENTPPNPPDTARTGGDANPDGSQALINKLKESKDVAQTSNAETTPPDQTTPDKTPDPKAFLAEASGSGTTYTIDPNVKLDTNGKIPDYTVPKDGVIAALYDQDQKAQEIKAATDPPDQQTAQKTAEFLRANPEIFQQVARANGYTNTRYSSPSSPITSTILSTAAQLFSTIVSAGANRLVNPPVDNVKSQIQYNKAQLDLQKEQQDQATEKRNQQLIALKSFTAKKIEDAIKKGKGILEKTQTLAKQPNLPKEVMQKIAAAIGTQTQQLADLQDQLDFLNTLSLAEFDLAQQQAQKQTTTPTGQTATGDQQSATDPGSTDPGSTASGTTDSGNPSQQQAQAPDPQQQQVDEQARLAAAQAQQAQALAAAPPTTPVATRTCITTCLLPQSNLQSFRSRLTANLCAQQGCPLGNPPDPNVVYVPDTRSVASGIQSNPAVNGPLAGSAIGQCTSSSNQVYLCRTSDSVALFTPSSLTASSDVSDKR